MNALQLKEGKFLLVPDVPEKPTTDADGNEPEHPQLVQYQYDYDQALSNSIEVAEECVELANRIIISEGHQVMLDAEFNNAGVVLLEYRATHIASVKDGNEKWTVMVKRLTPIEGELYPIEGLKYKVVGVNELLSSKQYQSLSNQNRDNAIIGYKKQVAIINK